MSLKSARPPTGCSLQHLAIVPQSLTVSARLRVGELVMMGRYPWHQGRPGPEDREIIAAALEKFALEPLRDRFLDALSGGQRQRALVAMAYAQGTPTTCCWTNRSTISTSRRRAT